MIPPSPHQGKMRSSAERTTVIIISVCCVYILCVNNIATTNNSCHQQSSQSTIQILWKRYQNCKNVSSASVASPTKEHWTVASTTFALSAFCSGLRSPTLALHASENSGKLHLGPLQMEPKSLLREKYQLNEENRRWKVMTQIFWLR